MLELAVAAAFLLVPLGRWFFATQGHRRRVDALDVRVHVNGIRGKSSVTRCVAGVLREAGYTTIAKTTGSAAVVIDQDGVDRPIVRTGPATILEQIEIIRRWLTPKTNALVIECMAINPNYQRVCERQIVRSQIGVLTNVREDHQDVMGETLPEIAESLLNTCPLNGVLITAEINPEIVPVIERIAASRGTELVVVRAEDVEPGEMRGFRHIEFEENVAVGLEVARRLGIDRDVALRGMYSAEPDPGVLRVENTLIHPRSGQTDRAPVTVTWANMFAVNDRESTIAVMERLKRFTTAETATVAILNNRPDRQQRAVQFADIASVDLDTDYLVTFGSFERVVTERLIANGYPQDRILNLGDDRNPTWDEIVDEMLLGLGVDHILLAGLVNIHTHQAEQMMEFFEHAETTELLLADAVNQP